MVLDLSRRGSSIRSALQTDRLDPVRMTVRGIRFYYQYVLYFVLLFVFPAVE